MGLIFAIFINSAEKKNALSHLPEHTLPIEVHNPCLNFKGETFRWGSIMEDIFHKVKDPVFRPKQEMQEDLVNHNNPWQGLLATKCH